jgi:hypothetical protein
MASEIQEYSITRSCIGAGKKNMGHGDRWSAVLQNIDRDMPIFLNRVTQKANIISGTKRRFVWPARDGSPEVTIETIPFGFLLLEAPVGYCAISVVARDQRSLEMTTFYPMPLEGIARSLTIQEVREDCYGLEGWIAAETKEGIPVSFFASDYFVHPERYSIGARVHVALSGIIYQIRAADPQEFVLPVTDPKVLRAYQQSGMKIELGESVRHTTGHATVMLPLEGWEPFDYKFQGAVKKVERRAHGSHDFYDVVATVMRDIKEEIDIRFVVAAHVLENYEPAVGSMMNAAGCIMGHLADFRWQESSVE